MKRLFALTSLMGCAGVLLALLAVGPALAWVPGDWEPPRFEVSGFGGWVHYDLDRQLNGEVYGGRFGYNFSPYIGAEAQFGWSDASSSDITAATTFWFSHADLLFNLNIGRVSPFIAAGVGGLNTRPDITESSENKFKLDAGGGLKLWVTERVAVRGDYRSYWSKDAGPAGGEDGRVHDYAATIGLSVGLGTVQVGPPDTDLDGITDDLDLCALTPMGVVVDMNGCPVDGDGDGVPDYLDRCSATLTGATVDTQGCPSDSDGDKIFDGLDQCAATPRGARVDLVGCPTDSDGDGIYDGLDQCQRTPTGVEVDNLGCPKAKPIEKKMVLRGITFATSSAEIVPSSYPALDDVVESMKAFPEAKIEIRGYADSRGTQVMNLKLTQERAESVRDYFASKGIDAERLRARGLGENDPIAPNETEEGRALNRRVELHRIDDELPGLDTELPGLDGQN